MGQLLMDVLGGKKAMRVGDATPSVYERVANSAACKVCGEFSKRVAGLTNTPSVN